MRPSARTRIIDCDIACQVYGMWDPQLVPSLGRVSLLLEPRLARAVS